MENLALRQQIVVLQRQTPKPKLKSEERATELERVGGEIIELSHPEWKYIAEDGMSRWARIFLEGSILEEPLCRAVLDRARWHFPYGRSSFLRAAGII